jgi:hypothetical protein
MRDVCDVKMLSTKYAFVMVSTSDSSTHRHRLSEMKLLTVTIYNNGKFGIDRSNQILYATTIRKYVK